MRVLYVEDNPTDADLARRILARRMPEVALELAPTLSAARFVLDRQPYPEAVLTDLRLPDGSGLELLAHIRERGLPLAVIILTGTGDQDSAVTALKSGADDYLVKRGDYLERLPRALTTALARFRTESARHGRSLQVLYVEHQAADIDLTRRHLARHAPYITLTPAGSVEEALRRLPEGPQEANPYQLVLMDYRLPGTDAFELAKLLLEERRLDLPLILITGQGSEEVAAQALRLGFADYLVKHPNYLNELPPVLEKVHIQAQLNRERTRLSETTARLNHLLTTSPTVLYALRIEGKRFLPSWISDNLPRIIGYPIEEALQPDWWIRNLHPDDHDRILADMERLFTEGRLLREYRFRHRNASYRWIRDELRLVRDDADRPVEAVGNWNDITEQRRAEEKLRLDSAAFASTRDAVLITDLEPRIVSVNRAFTKVTGYTEEEVLGRNPRLMQSGRQGPEFYRKLWQQLRQQGHWEGEIWNRRKRGEVYPQWLSISTVYDASGEPTHYVGVATDLSQLRRSEAQLDRLAHYDPLTDLPNRTLIQSQLEHLLARARRQQSRVGLLYIDLDRFKHINESMGHPVGDELLVAVAQRMQQRLRDTDILGRMSGDEFLILLESIEGPQDIAVVARDLLETMGTSFHLPGGQDIYIGASIGISLYPEDGTSADQLMRGADAALDLAKQEGRNNYRFHTESLTRAADERLRLEHRLRQALTREEFSLHYQPLVTVTDGKVVGAEALLRWHPPGEDMVPPGRFIPIAEDAGLIVPLGEWVLRTACTQIKAWLDTGSELATLSVNLSARQLQYQDMPRQIATVLEQTGLPPGHLELEITESSLMAQGARAEAMLQALKELGVRLAIDDFGTGYSSLAYLKRFPIDKLKVDRSFVRDITEDSNSREIAATIIAMGRNLRLQVLAEGVETEQQLDFLRREGCDTYQGFLFGRPVPADEFARQFLPVRD